MARRGTARHRRERVEEQRADREVAAIADSLPASLPGSRVQQPHASAVLSSMRGTLRVAHALREAEKAIPNIVTRSRKPKPPITATLAQGEGHRSPRRETTQEGRLDASPPPITSSLDRVPKCKPRPKDTRSKGGSGTGRAFVPYC